MPELLSSRALLKEWAITNAALGQARQIVLLRKGGLLDEDGSFTLEHDAFWLMPTWFHQERGLVKTEHLNLWEQTPRAADEGPKIGCLRHFARVAQVWQLHEDAENALVQVPHVWSRLYLDQRFSYQAEKPLLCAALRVWELEVPLRYELRPQDTGCRSWIETENPLEAQARPVLCEDEFQARLSEVNRLLEA
jgi:hypothetical protein